jgi:hypothetical protein
VPPTEAEAIQRIIDMLRSIPGRRMFRAPVASDLRETIGDTASTLAVLSVKKYGDRQGPVAMSE